MKNNDNIGTPEVISIIGGVIAAAFVIDGNWFYVGCVIQCFVFGFIAYTIGKDREMGARHAYVWGFLLSLIGLLIVISSEKNAKAEKVADEIIKLGELKDRGLITQEEFDNQKAKILS